VNGEKWRFSHAWVFGTASISRCLFLVTGSLPRAGRKLVVKRLSFPEFFEFYLGFFPGYDQYY
jgi:hypothetical protein